ncbi:MAG: addiction module protein [Rhodocyclaceae bacterium]|nr:addiction module protein [Rhodocyclaceae bacterium]
MTSANISIFELSAAEKLQLVEDLWDDIAASSTDVPVHDWQKVELDRRKASFLRVPESGQTWEHVRQRIRASHGN